MERSAFAQRLEKSARDAREFAQQFVIEALPPELRFRVTLNASFDGNPQRPGEVVFPQDSERNEELARRALTADEVITLLWRDGWIPEWINLQVDDAEVGFTVVSVVSCGRFTENEGLLYHQREGAAPFHVLGPSIPPGAASSDRQHSPKFSLHWSQELHADGLKRLRTFTTVELLRLHGPEVDDASLQELSACHNLTALRLSGCSVRGDGLRHIPRPKRLRNLSFSRNVCEVDELTPIASFKSLSSLAFTACTINLQSWSKLRFPAAIEDLKLERSNMDDAAIAALAQLPRLAWLDLTATGISDEAMRTLRQLPLLHTLRLTDTSVTDRGIEMLERRETLSSLDISNTAVSDAALESIAKIPSLLTVTVTGTRLSAAGIEELQQRRPALRIVRPTALT